VNLAFFANLFLVAFTADGLLTLADVLLRGLGSEALSALRGFAALVALLLSAPVLAIVSITPRLPARIFLPLALLPFWWLLGAQPVPLLVPDPAGRDWVGLATQAVACVWGWAAVRRRTGTRWLLLPEDLVGPSVSPPRTAACALAVLLLGPPILLVNSTLGLATLVSDSTARFIVFGARQVRLTHRTYVLGDQEVRLVGMMHVGEGSAYRELFDSFRTESTVVLEEGVRDQEGLLGDLSHQDLARALGLDPQPAIGEQLAAPDDGGTPEEWPHLRWADVDASSFAPETRGFVQRLFGVWASEDRPQALLELWRWIDTPRGRAVLEHVRRDVLERRNAHLIEELDRALPQYRRVIVPWGALHLPEVERALLERGFVLASEGELPIASYSTVLRALAGREDGADAGTN
jgi:hypothetical protein